MHIQDFARFAKNLKVILDSLKIWKFEGAPDQNMKAGDPIFWLGSSFIYILRMVLKNCPKTARNALFIRVVEFTHPPPIQGF